MLHHRCCYFSEPSIVLLHLGTVLPESRCLIRWCLVACLCSLRKLVCVSICGSSQNKRYKIKQNSTLGKSSVHFDLTSHLLILIIFIAYFKDIRSVCFYPEAADTRRRIKLSGSVAIYHPGAITEETESYRENRTQTAVLIGKFVVVECRCSLRFLSLPMSVYN